jgi:hypothetical protein
MDILRNLRRLESTLTKTVHEATQKMTPAGPRLPLEIVYAIVETVEKRIEPSGRGKYVFPFNRIAISIAADSRETRARFDAVFAAEPSLQDRIVQRLQTSGCEWMGSTIATTYVDASEPHWMTPDFHIEFDRVPGLPAPPANVDYEVKLTSIQGTTEQPSYVFTTSRINLGRCPEVRDSRNRLIRTNHVVFAESAGDLNLTVSRTHAHIDCADSGEYRLCDDRSGHGTSILRNGQTIPVPPGSRGVRIQSGDDIILGETSLHFERRVRKVIE